MLVERAFRDRGGQVRVLAATTTVAAGVNTPASTVVLAEQEFLGEEDGRPFTVAEYKNMAGRAGRLGFNERGRSIILANDKVSPNILFHKYVLAEPEPMSSSFDPAAIETWVLRLLSQVAAIPRAEIGALLAGTYGGYLANLASPGWAPATAETIERLVSKMEKLGLLEQDGDSVRLSLLGKVCGRSSLSFDSALRLVSLLRSEPVPLSTERLLLLIQALQESDDVYTPLMRGNAEDRWAREVAGAYGHSAAHRLQNLAADLSVYRARCKRAMVLHHWIRGTPMQTIEANTTTNAKAFQGRIAFGHVRQFADNARFHFRSASEIASVVLIDQCPTGDEIDQFLIRLEFGIPPEFVDLVRQLRIALTRGEILALGAANIDSVEKLWLRSSSEIQKILGEVVARQLEVLRPSPEPRLSPTP
jgi:replicative superfamily II helicase